MAGEGRRGGGGPTLRFPRVKQRRKVEKAQRDREGGKNETSRLELLPARKRKRKERKRCRVSNLSLCQNHQSRWLRSECCCTCLRLVVENRSPFNRPPPRRAILGCVEKKKNAREKWGFEAWKERECVCVCVCVCMRERKIIRRTSDWNDRRKMSRENAFQSETRWKLI